MNDAHVYEMQVQMWKPNTWGVTNRITADKDDDDIDTNEEDEDEDSDTDSE